MSRTLVGDKNDKGAVISLSDSSFGVDFLRHVPS